MGLETALEAIQAARGFEMTFAGLTITFSALGTIAICISLLPNFLKVLNNFVPEKTAHSAAKPAAKNGITDDVVAAIGLAYHSLKSSGK